jgi:hypothetical protein
VERYVPNVNDHDQRLIAGGKDMRAPFTRRIADPRYISTLVLGASSPDPTRLVGRDGLPRFTGGWDPRDPGA